MYVNQIDNIIDKILDKLYFDGLSKDKTFQTIVNGNKINYVEYREEINNFIKNFVDNIDTSEIQKLVNIKENIHLIMQIITRYVAYYYFLAIAYYYTGTVKDYRNNLIQYSKLQENSTFNIRNFFDTENNYQLVYFYKIIKDSTKILLMTELQKKTLDPYEYKDTINFLNGLGKEYIDNYLLMIINETAKIIDKSKKSTDTEVDIRVEINVHNLLKTIVFGEIYRNQDHKLVLSILNDIEENKAEYTYIDVIVESDEPTDFESFREIFLGDDNIEVISRDLFELVNNNNKIPIILSNEGKNNNLIRLNMITPIIDDFLRYHRDSERLEVTDEKNIAAPPLVSTNNAKNVQLALLYQQRKKKENTKAQLIINKIDGISDIYSENVKSNPELEKNIKKYFYGPLSYRKAVLINYLDEVFVVKKIRDMGRRAIEGNEYYLELVHINSRAYFNFKDFKNYGTSVNIQSDTPINVLRYSNIESLTQVPYLEVDMHTIVTDEMINMVGMALGPFETKPSGPIQCIRKENMIDIRSVTIQYPSNDGIKTLKTEDGYKMFLTIVKHFYVDTISFKSQPVMFYHDWTEISKLNPDIMSKVIYWVYDIEKDKFEMDTYENIKGTHFQEIIKFMNSKIYDSIIDLLYKRLAKLISGHTDLSIHSINSLVESFSDIYRLFLRNDDKANIIIREYLKKLIPIASQIKEIPENEKMPVPSFEIVPKISFFQIKIDAIDPTHPQEYIKLEMISKPEETESAMYKLNSKCQHEIEWKELNQYKKQGINAYNMAITQFIAKYVLETTGLEFVCKVCGQLIPIKQYVQDGAFDNTTQKFVTNYVHADLPLEEMKEYANYKLAIKYLDGLVNRVSLITNTNALTGPGKSAKTTRKALVKNILDLLIKHNTINLKKKTSNEERIDQMSKKFHVNKDLDNFFFFEFNDDLFNFTADETPSQADLRRFKFNNVLLYFILIFILELNGPQVIMMNYDKIANVYTFLKFGDKIFGDLLIKKNINNIETTPITNYPILCYLLFSISYFLIKYKLWYHPAAGKKTFDPTIQRVIIHSFVDMINSILIDASLIRDDYVYMLSIGKIYGQLNNLFKNNEVIHLLKHQHSKYSGKSAEEQTKPEESVIKTYYIAKAKKGKLVPYIIPNPKISSGIIFPDYSALVYKKISHNTNYTNCKTGDYIGDFHNWSVKDMDIKCTKCNILGKDASVEYDSTLDSYYFNLQKIADRRCISGKIHDFVAKEGEFVCSFCKRKQGEKYTKKELDELAHNLMKMANEQIEKTLEAARHEKEKINDAEEKRRNMFKELSKQYEKEGKDILYGQMGHTVDLLIKKMEKLIGVDTNVDIGKHPVYLDNDLYIIDKAYDDAPFKEPIIFKQSENRIIFRENHPFFKTDVYYYVDSRGTPVDVFYQAVSLQLIGYKEKFKDYVTVKKTDNYLKISPSIKNRLLTLGYPSKYLDITDHFNKNRRFFTDVKENYYQILTSLIKEHVDRIRSITDKIISMIYLIKNYQSHPPEESPVSQVSKEIDTIVSKFNKMLENLNIGENNTVFDDWQDIRDLFKYQKVDWQKTSIKVNLENMFVNTDLINYYDIAGNIIFYYLINNLLIVLESNKEHITKVNISQMYIEITNYVYNLYNTDSYKNSHEYKRFMYLLNSSGMMIDLLRRGQGLQAQQMEEDIEDVEGEIGEMEEEEVMDELEDLREEAEALDIENPDEDEEFQETAIYED